MAEAVEHNERVFLYGPSGTGKSALVRQIAAVVQRPVRRVSLNGETSVADFIGHWTVNGNKETVFVKGILPQAMQEGHILQMDEVDAMQPEVGFILQQILEPHGHLLLTDTGEDISPHPDFRLVATANTLGFGSDSGLYASGTHVLNFSWLDRWDVVVHIDYLPADDEVRLLHSRYPAVKKDLLKCMVKAAGDLAQRQMPDMHFGLGQAQAILHRSHYAARITPITPPAGLPLDCHVNPLVRSITRHGLLRNLDKTCRAARLP